MQHRYLVVRAAVAAGVVLLLIVLAWGALAWWQARRQATAQLTALAEEVLRRSAQTRVQVLDVFRHLEAQADAPSCSQAHLDQLRTLAANASYVQGIGVLDGDVLRCASLTELHAPVPLGRPSRLLLGGKVRSWSGVRLDEIPGGRFNVNAAGNYAAFIAPDQVTDVLPPDSTLAIAHIGRGTNGWNLIRYRGSLDPAWLRGYAGGNQARTFEGSRLVMRDAADGETAVLAAMPRAQLQLLWRQALQRTLPFAAAAALLALLALAGLLRRQMSLRAELTRALDNREFYLRYQPVVALGSGRCVGAEALIRWQRSSGPPIGPAEFIPVAEEHALICRITDEVMALVTADAQALVAQDPAAHIAINLSAADINVPRIQSRLQRMIDKAGIGAHNILVEVTERGLIQPETARDILIAIRSSGYRVAIDDFGTGHSSLSYLATYDLDFLKIDKSFVDAIDSDDPTSTLAFHIIGIAKSLGLQMIAEGVETERQRDILRDAGVQYAQGWLFGKPMSMPELLDYARAN